MPITLNNELHYIGLVKETYRNTIPEWPGNVVYQELGIDSIYWFSDEIFIWDDAQGYPDRPPGHIPRASHRCRRLSR